MAKLPEESQQLTEEGGRRRCGVCGEFIDETLDDMEWYEGKPAHPECAWEERQSLHG